MLQLSHHYDLGDCWSFRDTHWTGFIKNLVKPEYLYIRTGEIKPNYLQVEIPKEFMFWEDT